MDFQAVTFENARTMLTSRVVLSLLVAGTLTVVSVPSHGNPKEPSKARVLRLAKPSHGEWEVRAPSGERACQLPCEISVERPEGWSVKRLPADPDEESTEEIELPDLARFAPGTTLDAKVRPKAGNVFAAGIVTGLSLAVVATGLGLVGGTGCVQHGGDEVHSACLIGIGLLPLGLLGLIGGGIWLGLSHSGSVEIVRFRAPPPQALKIGLSGSVVALRF